VRLEGGRGGVVEEWMCSAALPDAGFAALCGCAGMRLLLARVWLCEDL